MQERHWRRHSTKEGGGGLGGGARPAGVRLMRHGPVLVDENHPPVASLASKERSVICVSTSVCSKRRIFPGGGGGGGRAEVKRVSS